MPTPELAVSTPNAEGFVSQAVQESPVAEKYYGIFGELPTIQEGSTTLAQATLGIVGEVQTVAQEALIKITDPEKRLSLEKTIANLFSSTEHAYSVIHHFAIDDISVYVAETMRQLFGAPKFLLAIPVFVRLARQEIVSKIERMGGAAAAQAAVNELVQNLLALQLALAEALDAKDDEQESYDLATIQVNEEARLTPDANSHSVFRTGLNLLQNAKRVIVGDVRDLQEKIGVIDATLRRHLPQVRIPLFEARRMGVARIELDPTRAL